MDRNGRTAERPRPGDGSVFSSKGQEQWRTTAYPRAERTDSLAPTGDTATNVIADARARTVERIP
ncbi:hypothetical protein ABZZ17_35835 [Streptomyces sp. NPDC006512]|uniref:hypothetical protein n=1 Tax=Streptomyces sp. NPDC006512 TaxID=3154307 RepID=UPI0033BC59ED